MREKEIHVMKNGPYRVIGGIKLFKESLVKKSNGEYAWEGRTLLAENKGAYFLCRCGASQKMPFCDGSHHGIDFDGTEEAPLDTFKTRAFKREGQGLALYDDVDLCSLSRFCNTSFGKVWQTIKEAPDEAKRQAIIKGAMECPSGRLLAADLLTGEDYEPSYDEVEISSTQDLPKGVSGPLVVRGKIPLYSACGKQYELRNRMTLCRCGKSQNMPFCDASHLPQKFIDHELLEEIKKLEK